MSNAKIRHRRRRRAERAALTRPTVYRINVLEMAEEASRAVNEALKQLCARMAGLQAALAMYVGQTLTPQVRANMRAAVLRFFAAANNREFRAQSRAWFEKGNA
jgi:predicted aconitase